MIRKNKLMLLALVAHWFGTWNMAFSQPAIAHEPATLELASSFPGLNSEGLRHPPDTMGAVGPCHIMTMLNSQVRIQDRNGNILSTVTLSNFWGAVGPFRIDSSQRLHHGTVTWVFDPRVLFDAKQQRWIVCSAADGVPTNSAYLLLGVSRTSDPTGDWLLHPIDVDPARGAGLDFPMLGFNRDWIVVQGAIFSLSNGSFLGPRIYVFNKTNLYAGGSGLHRSFQLSPALGYEQIPAITHDEETATLYLVRVVGEGNNRTSLQLHSISGGIGEERYFTNATITITNAWDDYPNAGFGVNFLPQAGATNKIEFTGSSQIGGLCLRNGALWLAHHVCLPAGGASKRTAVQWWQLATNGAVLQRGLIDDPAGHLFYAYPSIAVNRFNDVLIGYSRFSSNHFAGAYYSYRSGADPPNAMRADAVLKAGEAAYFWPRPNGRNRWGDYSQTVVDPVNDTDLWTIQEFAASHGDTNAAGTTSRWGTWWGRIVPPVELRFISIERSGGEILLNFATKTNQNYRVERTDVLASPILWEPVNGATNVPGTGASVGVIDPIDAPQRFYRIRLN